ncbi:porin [Thiomicrorhabdus sediminis]|uniref:Porin n=1 Tax=Thiomicrorhabdus sediminis TaxID=2580412 RepID=A0A4P9K2X0_9GAMM|nr:porin [Thiomicrorhabdus sediminis]QCU89168.1 porin [Thiomicrorhabdus sediminis]
MKLKLKATKAGILLALAGALAVPQANAANWLMLQGTEKPNQAPRAKVWGFAQVDYQQTNDTKLPTLVGGAAGYSGKKAAFNQMAPDLKTSSGFNIKRARIGVRGANFPLDKDVNYFLMMELGNNGITTGNSGSQGQLTDASVTINKIDGARVRVGLFKTPGSEESFKGIPVFNYVNFTTGTDQLLIEKKFDPTTGERTDPAFAARDTGIQVFDAFRNGDWETSYALMLGNGNGLAFTDDNESKDTYLYLSTEKIFGDSKGPRRHGMKFYAWNQNGKRTYNGADYDRTRTGVGMTYFDGKYRAAAEYFTADGMIFGGTTAGATPADGAKFSVQTDEKATAYQIDLGYRIKPNLELNIRYDALDRGTEDPNNLREFRTTTLGAQYFFNKKTSVRLNYEMRDQKAPNYTAAQNPALVATALDDRLSAQLMMIF